MQARVLLCIAWLWWLSRDVINTVMVALLLSGISDFLLVTMALLLFESFL